MVIEREIIYKVAIPKELKDVVDLFINEHDEPVNFTEKELRDFHRKLLSFAGEIQKAAGIYDAGGPSTPSRKAPYGSKKIGEILAFVNKEKRFVSAAEISVHFAISKERALKYMASLVNDKKVDVVKGEKDGSADPLIGPLPSMVAIRG